MIKVLKTYSSEHLTYLLFNTFLVYGVFFMLNKKFKIKKLNACKLILVYSLFHTLWCIFLF